MAMSGEKWDQRKAQGEDGWELEWKPQLATVVRAHPDGTFDLKFIGAANVLGTKTRVGMHRIECLPLKRVPQYVTYIPRGGSDKHAEQADILRIAIPDPPNSVSGRLQFTKHIGAVSERLQNLIDKYCAKPEKQRLMAEYGLNKEALEVLLWVKHFRSLADPGEAVGALAGQSVGEPSTQMTLNTFHLAGVGGGNVTLGIPRLREIIMTASKTLKTPTMTVPLCKGMDNSEALTLTRQLSRLPLSTLLYHKGGIQVRERLTKSSFGTWERTYSIRFYFENLKKIFAAFGVTFNIIEATMRNKLVKKLRYLINIEQRRAGERQAQGRQEVAVARPDETDNAAAGAAENSNEDDGSYNIFSLPKESRP